MSLSLKVEVFSSPGCGKCGKAKEVLRQQVDYIGRQRAKGTKGKGDGVKI